MGQHQTAVQVEEQAQAVVTLKDNLLAMGVEDPELLQLAIESETDFRELVEHILKIEGETSALRKGLDDYIKDLRDRVKRFKTREDWCRTVIVVALKQAHLPKLETSYGTVSLKSIGEKPIILEEADIPTRYWIEPPQPAPVLDEAALLRDLLARSHALAEVMEIKNEKERRRAIAKIDKEFPPIPGVTLSEKGQTIQIRRK